jgi:DNA-binding Xre family transcriptional regulator
MLGQLRSGAMTRQRSIRKKELKKKPGIAENNIKYPNMSASLRFDLVLSTP